MASFRRWRAADPRLYFDMRARVMAGAHLARPDAGRILHRCIACALLSACALLCGCRAGAPERRAARTSAHALKRGGTLRLLLDSDFDHLATTSAYLEIAWTVSRTFARQLVTYPPAASFDSATTIVPDIAKVVPSATSGGVSADGRTYVFHLQRGVRWNSIPPREVTATDFVRAFKMLCNPVAPSGATIYYTSTIVGMADYCASFASVRGSVSDIRQFVESRNIDGVRALDDSTLQFRLVAPSLDFLNILALPFASAIPEEYLDYLPDSPEFRQHTLSNGPYAITRYAPNRRYVLTRNVAWDSTRDPFRPSYVDSIQIDVGGDAAVAQLQVEAGTGDLSDFMLASDASTLRAIGDQRVALLPEGERFWWWDHLFVNVVDPNDRGALRNVRIREAIGLALNRHALVQLLGGPDAARALYRAAPSTVTGFRPKAQATTSSSDTGSPELVRRVLRDLSFGNGLRLRLAYMLYGMYPLEAQSIQSALRRAGIQIQLVPYTMGDFNNGPISDRTRAERGEWDLALSGGVPDWFGAHNGRFLAAAYDGRATFGSRVRGYDNPLVNADIDMALASTTEQEAERRWSDVVTRVTSDFYIIPLVERKPAMMLASRVRGCVWAVLGVQCSLPSVWLARGDDVPESSR